MAYTGAVVDIVGAEGASYHLLQHVAVLVRRSGAGETGQCIGTVLGLDRLESGCYQIQGLIPGCPFKFTGFPVLDQRIFKSFRRMNEIKGSESTLDAEKSLVGRSVSRPYIHHPVVLYHEIHLAAGGTVRTGGQNLLHLALAVVAHILCNQRTGRTYLRAVAAHFAF